MRHAEFFRAALQSAFCSTLLLLAGCGQKGDLYIPETSQLLSFTVF